MAEQVFSKTVENGGYGSDQVRREDFVAERELTVTITLSEYRQLLKQAGAYEAKLKEKEEYATSLWSENNKLKNTLETLRQGIEEGEE